MKRPRGRRGRRGGQLREILRPKQLLALQFGLDGGAIDQGPHFRLGTLLRQNVELLQRPLVLSGEREQFEQEGPALGIRRIVAEFRADCLHRLLEAAGTI